MSYVHVSVSGISSFSQDGRVSSTVSCAKDIHGYYACILRGEEIVWEKAIVYNGHARELFTLEWELSNAHHGDQFTVIGLVRGEDEEDDPVSVCSCSGDISLIYQSQSLVLS